MGRYTTRRGKVRDHKSIGNSYSVKRGYNRRRLGELVRAGEFITRKVLDSTLSKSAVCVELPQTYNAYSI